MNILILKPSSLGDVVQALPVLRLLRRHLPDSQIHWWIESALAPLLEDDPDLSGLVLFERQRWGEPGHWPASWRKLQWLRRQRFDWVLDLQSLLRSGLVAWLTNGRYTLGLDDSREGACGFYDEAVPRPSPDTHAVDWYLATLPRLGVPVHWDFEWIPERPAAVASLRTKWGATSGVWLALHPGARWANKRWPVAHFAALTSLLADQLPDARFALLGTAADRSLGDTILQAAPDRCLNLMGQTSLPEMVEWLRRSRLVITNDSGPMHVAVALARPVVALFGPTDPRRTGPYRRLDQVMRLDLPCAPCLKDSCACAQPFECLRALSPEAVAREALARLAAG